MERGWNFKFFEDKNKRKCLSLSKVLLDFYAEDRNVDDAHVDIFLEEFKLFFNQHEADILQISYVSFESCCEIDRIVPFFEEKHIKVTTLEFFYCKNCDLDVFVESNLFKEVVELTYITEFYVEPDEIEDISAFIEKCTQLRCL